MLVSLEKYVYQSAFVHLNFWSTKADSGKRRSLQEIGQREKEVGGDKGNHPSGNENHIVTKASENKLP